MSGVATFVLLGLLLVVVGGVIFAMALARRGKAQLARNLDADPDDPSGAPREWAGNHTPEAKLHRRLVALSRTADALPLGDAPAIERGVAVRQRIQEISRLLVAVAGAPESARREAVQKLTPDVDAAEAELAALAAEPPLH